MNIMKFTTGFCCALCLVLGGIFTVTVMAGEMTGIYVAPKFVYGLTQIKDHKATIDTSWGKQSLKVGNETKSTFGATFAVGYDFMKNFAVPMRAELEYGIFSEVENKGNYTTYDSKVGAKQKFNIHTLMLNAYYDVYTGTEWTPYIGAGLGLAFINSKGKLTYDDYSSYDDSFSLSASRKTNVNLAWQIGAGVNYAFNENVSIEAGYRFMGLGSAETKTHKLSDGTDSMKIYGKADNLFMHQFSIGMRYAF